MSLPSQNSTSAVTRADTALKRVLSWRYWLEHALFLATLFVSLLLREAPGSELREAVVWLPTGVAIAGLWRLGAGAAWVVALAALVVRMQIAYPAVIVISGAIGACAEALVGLWFIRRLGIDSALARIKDVARLFIVAAVAPLASILCSWSGRMLLDNPTRAPFYSGWDGWWRMNALGVLCVTPVLVIALRGRATRWAAKTRLEAAAVFATLLAVIALLLGASGIGSTSILLLYAVLPIAAFAAVRLGPIGAASTAALAAISIFAATLFGHGPFIALPIEERHDALQIFTFALLTGPLLIGAFVAERKRDQDASRWHASVLELIATGRSSQDALHALVNGLERLIPGSRASLLLLDGNKLRHALAPSMPAAYGASVDGIEIGPNVGSCGTAAYTGRPSIAPDLRTEPSWARHQALVESFDLLACWSMPVRDSKRKVLGTFAVYFDAPRSPTEEELELLERAAALAGIAMERERNEELLASINRSVNEGLFRSSPERGFHYVNDALVRMLGYDSAEELMKVVPADLHVEPERRRDLRARVEQFGAAASEEVPLRRRDGAVLWTLISAVVTRGPDGRTLHYDGAVVDVTHRRNLEERLRQAQKMEAVGRLAGGVAHDFNNLLTAIEGSAESLLMTVGDEGAQRSARQILQASERAAALTRQLLAYSRQQVLSPQLQDLTAVVDEMGGLLQRIIGEHIRLSIAHAQHGVFVNVDRVQIEQVLLNLAINARDALPRGGSLTIETAPLELDAAAAHGREHVRAGPFLRLRVRDDGVGMDELTLQRAFDPFFTTKEQGKGTGLGLSTVYGIVRQSGGFLTLESAPGAGTTATVYLPRAAAPAEASATAERPGATTTTEAAGLVLVVEDEPMVREIVTANLRGAGYRVIEAANGEEALEVASARVRELELVVTDRIMPRMGGDALAERLRLLRADLPVLLMSGYAESPAPEGLGAPIDHLSKPFARAELLRKAAALRAGAARSTQPA